MEMNNFEDYAIFTDNPDIKFSPPIAPPQEYSICIKDKAGQIVGQKFMSEGTEMTIKFIVQNGVLFVYY